MSKFYFEIYIGLTIQSWNACTFLSKKPIYADKILWNHSLCLRWIILKTQDGDLGLLSFCWEDAYSFCCSFADFLFCFLSFFVFNFKAKKFCWPVEIIEVNYSSKTFFAQFLCWKISQKKRLVTLLFNLCLIDFPSSFFPFCLWAFLY